MSQTVKFNSTTPAAPSGNTNVTWQTDGTNISGYLPSGVGASYMDILSQDKPTGTLACSQQGPVSVASGATQNLLSYSGSDGYVDSMLIAFDGAGTLNACTLEIYYDGEESPTVSVPLNEFFMANYEPQTVSSKYLIYGNLSGLASYYSKIPIPFTNSITIALVNTSGNSITLYSTVEYQTGVPNTWTNTRKLRVAWIDDQAGIAANSTVSLVNYSGGAGRLLGVWMLEDDYPGGVSPAGATLEGAITTTIDGGTPLVSSGTEDFFGLGFYGRPFYTNAPGGGAVDAPYFPFSAGGQENGLAFINEATPGLTTSLFRFFSLQRRLFTESLSITWNCGNTSRVSFTGTGTLWAAVWYYTED